MPRSRFSLSLFTVAALAVPLLASADPRYAVTVVAGAGSHAVDLNNLGQVAGWAWTGSATRGFVYTNGALSDIGTFGGADSWASSINDLGQVVGNATDASGAFRGFLYSSGTMTPLAGGAGMQAYAINNGGTITGSMMVSSGDDSYQHAFTLSGANLVDLGTLPYGDGSRAFAINSSGDVVGAAANTMFGAPNWPEDPFIYHNGVMTGLGNLGGPWSAATSINDHGQVVGYLGVDSLSNPLDLDPRIAFLYENGQMHMLESLAPDWTSIARDINNLGQVVGSADGVGDGGVAFLYENGRMIDLNTLIDPASGWTIQEAAAINDQQQIAANACRAGVCQAVRLDLVSAVPEPPVVALLAAGLALGLARGEGGFRRPVRRRRG